MACQNLYGMSEPVLYAKFVYKFQRIVGKPNFSDQFKDVIKHYKIRIPLDCFQL